MAKPTKKPAKKKLPSGPHKLTKAAEAREPKSMEKLESKPFEAAERRLGIERDYGKGRKRAR